MKKKIDDCTSFAEANALGLGGEYATKEHLLKNFDWKTENATNGELGSLKKLAFDAFPTEPLICEFTDEEEFFNEKLIAEARQSYVNSLELLKKTDVSHMRPFYDYIEAQQHFLGLKNGNGTLSLQYDNMLAEMRKSLFMATLLSTKTNNCVAHGYNTYETQKSFLLDKVGLKFIQCGASSTEIDRQLNMQNLTESILDLSDVLGIPPEKMSFGRTIGISIALDDLTSNGEYEDGDIQVSKEGVGCLAHEYFHSIDNVMACLAFHGLKSTTEVRVPENWLSSRHMFSADSSLFLSDRNINNLTKPYSKYEKAIKPFINRLLRRENIDQINMSYDVAISEIFARIGEKFVQRKLEKKGTINRYLVGTDTNSLRYPTDAEMDLIEPYLESILEEFKKSI